MAMKDKAALVLALSMFSGASLAAGMGAGQPGAGAGAGEPGAGAGMEQPGMGQPGDTAELQDQDRERFEQLDQAGTGEITREEAQADPQLSQQFDEIDRNQDGVIDQSEFAQFVEEQGQNGAGVGDQPGQPGGMGEPGAGGMDSPGAGGAPGTEPGTGGAGDGGGAGGAGGMGGGMN